MKKLTGALLSLHWTLDEFNTLNLRFPGPFGEVHAFIDLRNNYCDRGHFRFGISHGVPSLDAADSFPRYYMSLAAALEEAEKWLLWRLYKIDLDEIPAHVQLLIAAGREVEMPATHNGVQ
jgi:hypothetical protein